MLPQTNIYHVMFSISLYIVPLSVHDLEKFVYLICWNSALLVWRNNPFHRNIVNKLVKVQNIDLYKWMIYKTS